MRCTKWSSVINLDLFWKQVFSYSSSITWQRLKAFFKISILIKKFNTMIPHLLHLPSLAGGGDTPVWSHPEWCSRAGGGTRRRGHTCRREGGGRGRSSRYSPRIRNRRPGTKRSRCFETFGTYTNKVYLMTQGILTEGEEGSIQEISLYQLFSCFK